MQSPDGKSGSAPGADLVLVPATRTQAAYLAELGQRARDCMDRLIPPSADSLLAVLSRERRASLDMRLVGFPMGGPGKIDALASQIAAGWRAGAGLQVVLCETGLHSGRGEPWSPRSELAARLAGNGIPVSAVAYPPETPWPAATIELAKGCADGTVSVLIGMTSSLVRVPAIARLITAAHHLDAPYTPADARSRAALAPASSSRNFRYITEGYADAARWQALGAGSDPSAAVLSAIAGRAAVTGPPSPARRTARGQRAAPPRRGPRSSRG